MPTNQQECLPGISQGMGAWRYGGEQSKLVEAIKTYKSTGNDESM
jgi:hypothetical protein